MIELFLSAFITFFVVIDPPGWDTERTESLKAFFAPRAATAEGE